MKRKNILTLIVFICLSTMLKAQNLIDSSIKSAKTGAELKVMNKATDKLSDGIDKVFDGSIFKKKKRQSDQPAGITATDSVSKNITEISIDNAEYSILNNWAKQLKQNASVISVETVFDDTMHGLKVTHTGTPDDILGYLLDNSNGRLSVAKKHDNIISLNAR